MVCPQRTYAGVSIHSRFVWLLASFAVILLCNLAFGFDGNRKGFTIGFGAGYVPVSLVHLGNGGNTPGKSGLGLFASVGYGFSSQDALQYSAMTTQFGSNNKEDSYVQQGFVGPIWNHRFDSTEVAWYAAAGIGLIWIDSGTIGELKYGPGLLLGGGREISKGVMLGLYLAVGRTQENRDPRFQLLSLVSLSASLF